MGERIMKIAVKILPREVVLDTQGRAVENSLRHHGHELTSCRVGKYVVLDVPAENPDDALKLAKEMAESVLHNPLIENYELEVLSGR
jgi:phosphoribosylformylglycinamidine synthase